MTSAASARFLIVGPQGSGKGTQGVLVAEAFGVPQVATGDIFRTDSYPVIDLQKGGSVQGVIDGLNRVLDLAVPAHHEEGGTFIVPGHGRICDEFDVLEYRDMVTIVRDRVKAMKAKGMTLEQVKAARPTLDYDSRYGASTGAWTTDMFVEAVYRSVVASR